VICDETTVILVFSAVLKYLLFVEVKSVTKSNVIVKQKTGVSGTGRPRGRPRKVVVDKAKQATLSQPEHHASGLLPFLFNLLLICMCFFPELSAVEQFVVGANMQTKVCPVSYMNDYILYIIYYTIQYVNQQNKLQQIFICSLYGN